MAEFPGKVGQHVIARLVSQFAHEAEEAAAKDVAKTASKDAAERAGETVGKDLGRDLSETANKNYRTTFFKAHPELRGKVVVHHSVEQQIDTRFPGLFTQSELHDLGNLRGIPKDVNPALHLSNIRRAWDSFYENYPNPSTADVTRFRDIIDREWGEFFKPPV